MSDVLSVSQSANVRGEPKHAYLASDLPQLPELNRLVALLLGKNGVLMLNTPLQGLTLYTAVHIP